MRGRERVCQTTGCFAVACSQGLNSPYGLSNIPLNLTWENLKVCK